MIPSTLHSTLLASALLLAPFAGAQQGEPKAGRPILLNGVVAIVNDQIITRRDVDRELGNRHLTDPKLRGKPDRIQEERFQIRRRLASRVLLEQAIYSLKVEPEQLDAAVEGHVESRVRALREAQGSTKAFMDYLRDRGQSIGDLRRELRSTFRWQVFLAEMVDKPYMGRQGLLKVRPAEMLALYKAEGWRLRRELPGYAGLRILQVPVTAGRTLEQARALAGRVAEQLRTGDAQAKLPAGVEPKRFILVDCPRTELTPAVQGLGIFTGPGSPLTVSREDLTPPILTFALAPGAKKRVSAPIVGTGSVQVVQVEERVAARKIPFSDPAMQARLRTRLVNYKRSQAQMALVNRLWRRAFIWPPKLQRSGPPGPGAGPGR